MEIVNKVAQSGLITLDLEQWRPAVTRQQFDIQLFLWNGFVLREKEFREALKAADWEVYRGSVVAVFCSEDAIIPTWAWMLVATYLEGVEARAILATPDEVERLLYSEVLANIDWETFRGARVVVKGCSDKAVPPFAYAVAAQKLKAVAQSILFGEPCSTVPVWKRPKSV